MAKAWEEGPGAVSPVTGNGNNRVVFPEAGVAGLLNILVILDAIGRSDRSSSMGGGRKEKVPILVP